MKKIRNSYCFGQFFLILFISDQDFGTAENQDIMKLT